MTIEKTDIFIEHDIIVDGTKIGTVELCPERHKISRLIISEPYRNKGYDTQVVQELVQIGYRSFMFEMMVGKTGMENKKR